MKAIVAIAFSLSLAAGVTFVQSSPAAATCEECVEATCLLGCGVNDPNCSGLEDCEQHEWGCSGSSICNPLPAQTWNAEVGVAGTYAATGVLSQDDLDSKFASFETNDALFHRRMCDAVVVNRRYDAQYVEEMRVKIVDISV